MIEPQFIFYAEANAYISEPVTVEDAAIVEIELAANAPVVTLKMKEDGEYANYGQTPEPQHDAYKIKIVSKDSIRIKLATPVEVTRCVINN